MRNEMRGFFFLSYALICVCMSYLCGGLYYGGGLWAGLALIFFDYQRGLFLQCQRFQNNEG